MTVTLYSVKISDDLFVIQLYINYKLACRYGAGGRTERERERNLFWLPAEREGNLNLNEN